MGQVEQGGKYGRAALSRIGKMGRRGETQK